MKLTVKTDVPGPSTHFHSSCCFWIDQSHWNDSWISHEEQRPRLVFEEKRYYLKKYVQNPGFPRTPRATRTMRNTVVENPDHAEEPNLKFSMALWNCFVCEQLNGVARGHKKAFKKLKKCFSEGYARPMNATDQKLYFHPEEDLRMCSW